MSTKFTEEQLKAIQTTDRSVLVSAAAGSGKTAVLIERIINIILGGKADVDEMLVVTFTNAAAAEMRLRLSKAIRKRMAEHPEDAPRMKDQLSRLYKAYISTIDSFALRVIREFFHETDIEPSFSVCDDVQGELLRREAVTELFEEGFSNDSFIEGGSFRAFLRLYSEERTDEGFMENLMSAYSELRSMPDYFDWAYDKAEQLKVTAETFEGSALQAMMQSDALESFGTAIDLLRRIRSLFDEAGIPEMYEEKLKPQEDFAAGIYDELNDKGLDLSLLERISDIPSVRLTAKKDQKEAYEMIKAEVKRLREALKKELDGFRNRYVAPNFKTRLAEMNATYGYTIYYLKLLEEFERRYDEKKREKKLLDFADTEHLAVRILKKPEASEVLRKRFKYIFVDEYQDTNNIQESLISSVARPGNVFRVGDVKQSIYRFRQAEPEIFERLYKKYTENADGPAVSDKRSVGGSTSSIEEQAWDPMPGIAIDLGRNFRTNDRTIRYINHVFRHIMEGYDERAMLYTGLTGIPDEYDFMPEVHVLLEENGSDSVEDAGSTETAEAAGSAKGGGMFDEEIESISKEEAEAEYIAKLAASIIGTEFFDSKAGIVRKAEARDIAILFRAVRYRGEIMSRALREHKVEPHIEDEEDYFDTIEVNIALSLLSCIDNMKRDIPLIAVLHSEIFGFSPVELAAIRTAHSAHERELAAAAREEAEEEAEANSEAASQADPYRRPAYYEAFDWYASDGPEGELKDRAAAAREAILGWKTLSRMLPLEDFVWKVLVDSGYYRMAGAMPDGARRQANLRTLADRAGKFSKENIASLSSFIGFLEVLKNKKIKSGQAPLVGKDDDVVRISTIHKSKGLEYPFVIVGGLGHKFREDTNSKSFSFDSGIGVGLPYVDPSRRYWRSTIIQRAINLKSKRDEYREELRLLYVAMTRARNKLYMVGTAKNEEDMEKHDVRPKNFLKAMSDVLRSGFNSCHVSPLELTKQQQNRSAGAALGEYIKKPLSAEEQALYDEIDRRFSYRYPDEELLTAKAKYSVSEIRRMELEKEAEEKIAASSRVENANADATVMVASANAGAEAELKTSTDPGAGLETDPDESDVRTSQLDNEVVKLWRSNEKKKKASAADIGVAYHRIMEFLDFTKACREDGAVDEAYINERAEFLRKHEAIDEDVFRSIDLGRIKAFFSSELGQRCIAAAKNGTLSREKPFTLKTARDGHEMLVQGVIDCCFEENGKMVLIDYKSSFIKPGRAYDSELARIKEEYKVQIELYSEAVRKGTDHEVAEAYLWLFTTAEALRVCN